MRDNTKEALECFTSAIKIKPDYFEAYVEMATLKRRLGIDQEALVDLERSIAIKENSPAYYLKSRILAEMKQEDEAKICFGWETN